MESLASGQPAPASTPSLGWKWRTFPVYFAFALGSFLGVYAGILSAWLNDEGESWLATSIFIAVAIMMGLGLSRLTTRWLVTRRWIRTRQQRAAR
jgi:hypothetical protein